MSAGKGRTRVINHWGFSMSLSVSQILCVCGGRGSKHVPLLPGLSVTQDKPGLLLVSQRKEAELHTRLFFSSKLWNKPVEDLQP